MLETQKRSAAASSSPLRRRLAPDSACVARNRPFISYSHFGLEVFYKRSLRAFSEDLRSPYRLILEDLRREFGLRGLTPPSDADTSKYIDVIRRLAHELVDCQMVESDTRLAS